MKNVQQKWVAGLALALLVGILAWQSVPAQALPTGATVTNYSTETVGTGTAGNRSDARGTITTLLLNATQQDQFWKGYVGNVTGALTLDDASGNTIYDWSLTGVTITGEVYVTRAASPDFDNLSCANSTTITTEQTFHNMTATQSDNINSTFSSTTHASFVVAGDTITNSTCQSTFTYIGSAAQTPAENASFQEILMQDTSSNLIYVTLIEDDLAGFDGETYDFQLIVAESDVKASPTTYYFFTEISTA